MKIQFVRNTELMVNDVVHAYGAVWRIKKAEHLPGSEPGESLVALNTAEWLSGRIERGYFGPGRDWIFQGTGDVSVRIEMEDVTPKTPWRVIDAAWLYGRVTRAEAAEALRKGRKLGITWIKTAYGWKGY